MHGVAERLGILGGAFDPLHIGHLILAEQARWQLGLERVLFIPSFDPPKNHKSIVTSFAHRCEMLTLALEGIDYFEVSRIEEELEPPTFSVRMLEALSRKLPGAEFYFLMGADSLEQLDSWYEPEQLRKLCRLAVARRVGHREEDEHEVTWLEMPLIAISASELRRRVEKGISLRFLVPDRVIEYIAEHNLYKSDRD